MKIKKRQLGLVELLCKEIGAVYCAEMESTETLIRFVAVLVDEIEEMLQIKRITGIDIPKEVDNYLLEVRSLLTGKFTEEELHIVCKAVSEIPDTDQDGHFIDMFSSCVSVLLLGLDKSFQSRHAASAANFIFTAKYGITLFDEQSARWGTEWARDIFYKSLVRKLDQQY